jgi:hypothetical protein
MSLLVENYCDPILSQIFLFIGYEWSFNSRVPMKSTTDYGRPIKPFFIETRTFGLGQTNWADKFWGIWGIFSQTSSTHFGTVSPLFFVFHYSNIISTKN